VRSIHFSCSYCKLKGYSLYRLKRKSAEPDPSAQGKKPRLHDTSQLSVLPPAFSRSGNVERALKYVVLFLSRFRIHLCVIQLIHLDVAAIPLQLSRS
jgi:hypothetical protein